MHDKLVDGRSFRILNIIDDFVQEAVATEPDTSFSGKRVARVLDALAVTRAHPKIIRCDDGLEFKSKAMRLWAFRH